MTAGPCVSLAKITTIPEKTSSATPLGGPRRRLTGVKLVVGGDEFGLGTVSVTALTHRRPLRRRFPRVWARPARWPRQIREIAERKARRACHRPGSQHLESRI